MSEKKMRQLRKQAKDATIGKSELETEVVYEDLKTEYRRRKLSPVKMRRGKRQQRLRDKITKL